MKFVVTGAAGFVGSHLSRQLLDKGHEVVGIDSMTDYYDVAIKRDAINVTAQNRGFTFLEADLNTMDLGPALAGANIVFHLAGQPGVRKSWGDQFAAYVRANVSATQRLLEACVEHPSLSRLVYASSSSVYGDTAQYPTAEDILPRPMSPYGVTKLAGEHLCGLYAKVFGVPTVSLRYFTVYGPGQRPDMAFTRFTRAAILGDEIEIYGNGSQVRDYTFVDDVVRANLLAGEASVPPGAVYNIAGGTNASMTDVLDLLGGIHGRRLRVQYTSRVPGDVLRTGGDAGRAFQDLNWLPQVSLEEGLRRHYDWALSTFRRRGHAIPGPS